MSKRGVSKITGNSSPKIGEATVYTVTDWYPATPENQRNVEGVTWELFKKRSNGSFTSTNIKKRGSGTFTFGEVAQRNTYRLEAYLYESEGDGASSIEISPQPVTVPRINKVELQYVDDSPGTVFSYTEKMRARAQCVNLTGEKLKFSLWEDDATGDGHNANNLLIETKEATVNSSGVAVAEFMLTRALMQKAMQGETDPQKLEFYVTVEYFQDRKHATDNVNVNNPSHIPPTRPNSTPQQPARNPAPAQPAQPSSTVPPRAQGSPAADKPQSQKEEKGIVDAVTDWWNKLDLWDWAESPGTITPAQAPTQQPAGGRTTSVVQDSGVEDLLDAYFAKKEYTKQTGEVAGTFEYKIGSNGNKTATDAEKESIAQIILGKASVKALADKKEYTTLAAIKQGLTKEVYNKDEKVTFQTFKLGAEFKKINSAPLEGKVYLVARTSGLNGKQVTIIIKEKEGLIKGSAGAVLPVLEITEAQMEQTAAAGTAVPGTEKTQFLATVENGVAKVPVHLRPKSDDDLKIWKEKISKGKEDGEYTYKFGGENRIADENAKKRVAETILRNAKSGNASNQKIADGKSANVDDIVKALEIKTYQKDETIKFKLYKKEQELLFLQAKAQGTKQHDKEFLKSDGAYFVLGKNCFCNRDITLAEFESILKKLRESEGVANTTGLFYRDNCNLDDKTNASFIAKINEKFKEHEINTCIRKIHFLTQVYHETDKFQTTLEYANGIKYDPGHHDDANGNGNTAAGDGERYKGKGLMQLTWKNNYKKYKAYSGEDVIGSPLRVSTELNLAVDSAVWFWTQGKVLGAGTTWSVPNTTYSQYDQSTGKQFPKTQISKVTPDGTVSYATINMNLLADKDYIDTISWLVNGGGNGRQERRDYLKEIKKIFNYPQDCANAGSSSAGNSGVTIHFVGDTALESGISQRTRTVLEEVGTASKNTDIYITSTARTPADQARIMYDNISRTGAAEQKGIYANAGDQVIDVYTSGNTAHKTEAQIIQDMEAKINELGPSSVSKHLADPNVMNTFDVSIRRLANPNDFKTEMQKRTELHQLLDENGAYHVEINQ